MRKRINDEPWFVGKDVAEALGFKRTADALSAHVDDEYKNFVKVGEIPTLNVASPRGLYIINESGLYSLILSSKLPDAKKFKRWVTQTQDRGVNESFTVNGTMATIINESGLYSLILSSKLTHHVSIIKRMSRFTTPI